MCSGDSLIGKALGTATGASMAINNKIQDFSNTLLSEAKTVFGDANQTFNTLSGQATQIWNGEPSQLGWSTGQTSATNAGIVNNATTAERNLRASQVGGAAPGVGGTNNANFVNSEAALENQQAVAENTALQENYKQGNENWKTAGQVLETAPNVFKSAEGFNTEAAGELNTAQKSQQAIDKQNNWQEPLIREGLNIAGDVATGGLSGMAEGALGNLDTTGGSSFTEQLGNLWNGAINNPGGKGTMPAGASPQQAPGLGSDII